ncbi:MAG: GNAT family N-acetyltransferase [Bauldia sp.]
MSEENGAAEPGSLSTQRLVLRRWRASDAVELAALAGQAAGGREGEEIADARGWIARARVQEEAATYVVALGGAASAIGACALAPAAEAPSRREVGIWIGEAFSGRGYATEALQVLIDWSFAGEGPEQLWGVCRVTNARARRVMEKCGFQFRESGMARSVVLRGAVPVERFVLEKRNWLSLKAWGAGARAGAAA